MKVTCFLRCGNYNKLIVEFGNGFLLRKTFLAFLNLLFFKHLLPKHLTLIMPCIVFFSTRTYCQIDHQLGSRVLCTIIQVTQTVGKYAVRA